jgi:hypothetical protein
MLRTRITFSTTLFVASALLTGCFPDYFPRRQLKVKLSPAEMAGHWHLGRDSARILARYHVPATSADSWIDFSADGRCELHRFVDGEDVVSGSATWKIDEEREDRSSRPTSVLHITFQTTETPVILSLYFTRHHRKFVLWQYHDDPDGREYIEYESI